MAGPLEAVLHELQQVERQLANLYGALAQVPQEPTLRLASPPPVFGGEVGPQATGPEAPGATIGQPWTDDIVLDLSQARDRERVPMRLPMASVLTVKNLSELEGVSVTAWLDDPSGPGFDLLAWRALQFSVAFRYLFISHAAYPGRRLRLQVATTRLVRAEPKDQGQITVVASVQTGGVATESTLSELRNVLAPNSGRRFALDLTVAHTDLSLAQALGMAVPIRGVGLTILRLGSANWSMKLVPPSRYPDTWLSTDFNEGAQLIGLFDDILFSNAATAGATPAIFSVALRV